MRCILHVGPAKTGTSSIQGFLRANRETMRACGILVPPTRIARADEFYIAILQKYRPNRILAGWGIFSQNDLEDAQPKMVRQLETWLSEDRFDTVVVSHEGLGGLSKNELVRLRHIIERSCEAITVVTALRRQDLLLNSVYKNAVRNSGKTEKGMQKGVGPNHADKLDALSSVFGKSNVHPFLLPDSAPQPGDLISDFLDASDLPLDGWIVPERKIANETWDARSLEILRQVNALLPPLEKGRVRKERICIENAILAAFPEKEYAFHIGLERAKEIISAHEESNRRAAQQWFGRDQLFSQDMSIYDSPIKDVEAEDFIKVIVCLAQANVESCADPNA